MNKKALRLALEALDMMVVPRGFQAQARIKEIYGFIEETLAQPEHSAPHGGPVTVSSWDELKIMMRHSAFGEVLQLNDALENIKEFTQAQSKQKQGFEVRYFEQWQGQPIEEIDEVRFNQAPEEYRFKLYTSPPQHVLMAEHWKSMYEQLKASAYTPDDEALTEEQINQLKKTAPRRLWVGLTHEDIDKAIEDNQRFGGFRKVGFAYDLESLLKERNT